MIGMNLREVKIARAKVHPTKVPAVKGHKETGLREKDHKVDLHRVDLAALVEKSPPIHRCTKTVSFS
jgi:hypothetical protein